MIKLQGPVFQNGVKLVGTKYALLMGKRKYLITLKMATLGAYSMHGLIYLQCFRKNKDFDPI